MVNVMNSFSDEPISYSPPGLDDFDGNYQLNTPSDSSARVRRWVDEDPDES